MATRKDPKAKKASLSRSARHRITARPGDTRASRLAPLTNSRKPATAVRPTKSPLFPRSTATTAPIRTAKPWQEWEMDLMISLSKAGRTFSEISQQLPGRSMSACKRKMFDIPKLQQQDMGINHSKKLWQPWEEKLLISLRKTGRTYSQISKQLPGRAKTACQRRLWDLLKSQKQDHSPRQNHDLMVIQDSSQKRWQAWEEELLISSFKIGKSYADVSRQLPRRSQEACRMRLQKLLKPREPDLVENPVSARLWEDWEDQLITNNYDVGKGWAEIYKLLPSRTKGSILGRWQNLKHRVQGFTCSQWGQEEDQLLVDLYTAGEGCAEIAKKIPNRSMSACAGRWKRLVRCHPDLSKGGRLKASKWSQAEDQLLINLHAAGKDWAEIAKKIPNRTKGGCTNRWGKLVHCDPELKKRGKWKCGWTKLEIEKLISLVNAIGPRFYDIAKELPSRTQFACEKTYSKYHAEESRKGGPSREKWLRSWDKPEETEIDSSETGFAALAANEEGDEEGDLNAGESDSAPVIVAPSLKRNQTRSFNAKKRQAIHVPMV